MSISAAVGTSTDQQLRSSGDARPLTAHSRPTDDIGAQFYNYSLWGRLPSPFFLIFLSRFSFFSLYHHLHTFVVKNGRNQAIEQHKMKIILNTWVKTEFKKQKCVLICFLLKLQHW